VGGAMESPCNATSQLGKGISRRSAKSQVRFGGVWWGDQSPFSF